MMDNELKIKPVISNKPYSIPIEMRPLWRICLIIICINFVDSGKDYLSSKKVNILVWMLIRKNNWQKYEDYLLGRSSQLPLISIDTATFKAVEFSVAKEFIRIEKDRFYITQTGRELVSILNENKIMDGEITFLSNLGKKLTEDKVKALTGGFR